MFLGPNQNRDNLVLNFDAGNINCFKGEPTTNLATTLSINSQGGSFTLINSPDGSYNNDNAGSNLNGQVFKLEVTITGVTNNGGFTSATNFNLTGGTTYLWLSFNAYLTELYNGSNGSLYGYVAFKNSGGTEIGTINWTYFVNGIQEQGWSNNQSYLNKWIRVGARATILDGGVGVTRWYIYADNLRTGKMYVARIQIEQKDIPTSYVNGIRGTTVATGGGLLDLSTSNKNGQLYNLPTYSSDNMGSLTFGGYNDIVYVPSTSGDILNPSSYLTVLVWVYIDTTPDRNRFIVAKGWGDSYELLINSANVGFHILNTPSSGKTVSSTYPLLTRTWYQIVGVYNSIDLRLYINGYLNNVASFNLPIRSYPLSIGIGGIQHMTTAYPNNGIIGEISYVQIYNKALSDVDILQNYNSLKMRYEERFVIGGLIFHLNVGKRSSYPASGTTWYDISGWGFNGTLVNSPTYDSTNSGSLFLSGGSTFGYTNDYISCSTTGLSFGTGDFTLEAIFKISSDVVTGNTYFKGIIVKKGANGTDAGFGLYYNTGYNKFLWSTANGSSYSEIYSQNSWSSLKGTYAHVVMVRQSGATNNGFFYINGVYESLASSATILDVSNTYTLMIGSSSTLYSAYYFRGNIAVAMIYNRALTASEILQNYNAFKFRYTSTLCSGGTETISGNYKIHTFLTGGTLTVTRSGFVQVLVVAGGGSGGNSATSLGGGGGGGAGGLIYNAYYPVINSIVVTVGSGGSGTTSSYQHGNNGGNSIFGNLLAIGGGYGGSGDVSANIPSPGGSGGGAGYKGYLYNTGATYTINQGFGGGNVLYNNNGGGGGGAGGPGGNTDDKTGNPGPGGVGGYGGSGLTFSISGSPVVYATGGQGGEAGGSPNAAANTGNGSNGIYASTGVNSGNGGSGIIIVRYLL